MRECESKRGRGSESVRERESEREREKERGRKRILKIQRREEKDIRRKGNDMEIYWDECEKIDDTRAEKVHFQNFLGSFEVKIQDNRRKVKDMEIGMRVK